MAANTGPDENTYQIPDVLLGDTFNVWKDITNTSVYKLNKMEIYKAVSSDCLTAQVDSDGRLTYILNDIIVTGHTFTSNIGFTGPVVFTNGVTFNGPVTFNAPTFTVNANTVTIDDYNILLGDTADANDTSINIVGGGGIILNRGSGLSADWLWTPLNLHGQTGMWAGDGHIGFKGVSAGIRPHNNGNLLVHGSGIRLDGSGSTEHGMQISFGGSGTTASRTVEFVRYSPSGSTAFVDVELRAAPSVVGARPYMNIRDGANKKTITQVNHQFIVGTPLLLQSNGNYATAIANTPANSEVIGVVSRVIDGNNFELTFIGEVFNINFPQITIDGTAGSTGSIYYLSPYVAGKVSTSYPTQVNTVHKAVLVATSSTSAIVIPWTGGVLSETVTLAESSSNTILISQINQFKPGDVVQFKPYLPNGITLSYGSGGGLVQVYYPNGIYVRADARDDGSALNIAGMVVSTAEYSPNSGINRSFNLMMDGFFSVPGGFTVMNGGTPGRPRPGDNYYLGANVIGTTGCFEGLTASLSSARPTAIGTVDKPMMLATSETSGYVYSYRGAVNNISVTTTGATVDVSTILIQDIRSTTNGDLVFGVFDNSILGGRQVMRFDSTNKGNVRIGPTSFNSSSDGAGATLSVAGIISAGDATATSGSVIACSRYDGALPRTLNVFGSQFSTGNTVLSYGVRPIANGGGYASTNSNSLCRAAIEVGVAGTDDPALRVLGYLGSHATPGRTGTAVGSAVPLTELMRISGLTAVFAGMAISSVGFSGPHFGNLAGNANTASTLQTPRTISLGGKLSGSASFNGGSDITLTASIPTGGIATADLANLCVTDDKLATITAAGKIADSATSATHTLNAGTIVRRNSSDFGFSSGLITCPYPPSSGDHLTRKAYVDGMTVMFDTSSVILNRALAAGDNTTRMGLGLSTLIPVGARYAIVTFHMHRLSSGSGAAFELKAGRTNVLHAGLVAIKHAQTTGAPAIALGSNTGIVFAERTNQAIVPLAADRTLYWNISSGGTALTNTAQILMILDGYMM